MADMVVNGGRHLMGVASLLTGIKVGIGNKVGMKQLGIKWE